MNLILLFEDDFIHDGVVRLSGRRFAHVSGVHRATAGDTLTIGIAGGGVGTGTVTLHTEDVLEMAVTIDRDPPPPIPLTLVLALPRPKVLNRVIAAASSLGVKSIHLINAWRVEKSYWGTPRLSDANLHAQSILGLEQAKDTMLPSITTHRLFRAFVERELPGIAAGGRLIAAHPGSAIECPRDVAGPVTLVVGPEGGFVEAEVASLSAAGAELVHLGPRILRVETAVATLIGRMF
jgi:16S rRNA (uracil1498-N3)-methyltransferase